MWWLQFLISSSCGCFNCRRTVPGATGARRFSWLQHRGAVGGDTRWVVIHGVIVVRCEDGCEPDVKIVELVAVITTVGKTPMARHRSIADQQHEAVGTSSRMHTQVCNAPRLGMHQPTRTHHTQNTTHRASLNSALYTSSSSFWLFFAAFSARLSAAFEGPLSAAFFLDVCFLLREGSGFFFLASFFLLPPRLRLAPAPAPPPSASLSSSSPSATTTLLLLLLLELEPLEDEDEDEEDESLSESEDEPLSLSLLSALLAPAADETLDLDVAALALLLPLFLEANVSRVSSSSAVSTPARSMQGLP